MSASTCCLIRSTWWFKKNANNRHFNILYGWHSCIGWNMFLYQSKQGISLGAKVHLTILIGFVVAFVVWGFMLDRFTPALYRHTRTDIFMAWFIEIRYQLATHLAGNCYLPGDSNNRQSVYFFRKTPCKAPFLISLTIFLCVVGLSKIQLSRFNPKYIVNPNPVRTNKSLMQHNIDSTLDAYDLRNIKTVDMTIKLDARRT